MMKAPLSVARYHLIFNAFVLVACLLWLGCQGSNRQLIESAPLVSHSFKDDFGRQIVLTRIPTRVVSLASNITEIIFAIGGQNRLAGVSHDSDYPSKAGSLPYVITYPDFDLPEVAAMSPDIILASTEIHDQGIAPFFDRYGIPLHFSDYKTLDDIFGSIREIGQMLECTAAANHLADSLAAMTKMIADSTAGQIKYKTAIILGIDPITVVGGNSFMHDLLQKAGASNVFGVIPEKYPKVTPEQFIQAAPEYVLIPTRNDRAWSDLVAKYPDIYNRTPATELNHIYQMEPDVIVRPGPRIVEGLAYITRVLHSRVNLPL